MTLRSGNTLTQKKSFANNDETKEDIISSLPDSLLIDILSLLSSYDVKRTRMVSKRWKNLFAFLPNLYFVINSYSSIEQGQKTLAIRGDIPIEKLSLECKKNCDYDCFHDLLCTLVRFKAGVRELELIRSPVFSGDWIKVCWDLFKTWDSLVGLTLSGLFVLDVPNDDELLIPCLKKISLIGIQYATEESVANLFSGCPVLEELFVERGVSFEKRLEVFNISSLSLKRVRISIYNHTRDYKVVIDAPKLEYIFIRDHSWTNHYSLTKPLSLVEADILHNSGVIYQLVPFLSSAKILKLTSHPTCVLDHVRGLDMPMFPNLVRLVIGRGFYFLLSWLNYMPNLEHITFSYWDKFCITEQDLPDKPPVCMRFKMKKIVVCIMKSLTQEDFTFICYLLENSIVLENFIIKARRIDPEWREQLLDFHHGSKGCQIELITSY